MKRYFILPLLFLCCILLCSCKTNETKHYEQRISYYESIANYALENYIASDGSRVTVLLSDITDSDLSESIQITEENFSFMWIEDGSVIFWNNEMKTSGLIYSEKPKSVIRNIKTWYNSLETEKINNNFYLIGQLSAI